MSDLVTPLMRVAKPVVVPRSRASVFMFDSVKKYVRNS